MAWSLVIWVSEGWKYGFFVLAESMSKVPVLAENPAIGGMLFSHRLFSLRNPNNKYRKHCIDNDRTIYSYGVMRSAGRRLQQLQLPFW
jgi:hypothetical protein